jgi:proteic killer suppression protein
MEVQFNDPRFDRLENDPDYTLELPRPVVTEYRMCLQLLRAAASNADLSALRQLNLSDLPDSPGYKTISLADGCNLVLQPSPGSSSTSVRIIDIAVSKCDGSAK